MHTPYTNGASPSTPYSERPLRQKKRRRYDEGSYEGYDGYESTEPAPNNTLSQAVGGDAWDGEKKKKKRKKVHNPPQIINPQIY